MQKEDFKRWLEAQGQAPTSVASRVSVATRVEQHLGDLEALFAREGLDVVLGRFAYSAEDARAGRPNPSAVPIDGDLRTGLASIQQSLKLYHRFLTQRTTMPDKDAHLALIKRLTRKEIDAAMADCDRLGRDAFLAQGGFARPKVWALNEAETQTYPAKSIVAAALGHLPDGRALSAKAFFNGWGDTQAPNMLETLGYRIIRNADGAPPDGGGLISRASVEGAMDAFDQFRSHGAHDAVFGRFGEPSTYWVRSTRARENRIYPTKPLVGFILNKTELNGGWAQKSDAAARLHNAGFIIVDQDDKPIMPEDRYQHLMSGADRVRLCALNYVIAPAREQGASEVSVKVSDLAADMGLKNVFPTICEALGDEKFQQMARTPPPTHTEPNPSSTTTFTYALGSQIEADATPRKAQEPMSSSTNTILYGPPGTGKTYATASRAVAICDGVAPVDRAAVMTRYDDLRREGRIEFITFHQSYGYEDFVEGLRPQTGGEDGEDTAGFRLVPEDGVLKRMASRARSRPSAGADFDFAGRRVFKVSLGRHNHPDDQALREECLADGWFMLGWGGEIDWSKKTYASLDDIAAEWRSQPGKEDVGKNTGDIAQTNSMVRRMRPGDVVVASRGNSHICAIGLIDGPYEFHRRDEDGYHHRRKVKWTWKAEDDAGIEASDIYGRNLVQSSVYEMAPSEVRKDALAPYLAPAEHAAPPPHVLIIDEINRANVSKVLGELITLLEEDKRAGGVNALSVTLPFSKDSFSLPANLHILGAMNTADRSIALLDTALRRRFRFEHVGPDPSVLAPVDGVDLPAALRAMNDRLEWLLGPDHLIGHAWFMGAEVSDLAALDRAMRDKVIPLLREYFHEDLSRVRAVLGGGNGFLRREKLAPPPGIEDGYEDRHRYVDAWNPATGYGPAAWAELIGAAPA